ncbi:MAG TPA: YebC/PmpR family DNA-binding transcriptional regulator [Candidatus Paceibacterota bacterium]|nr:YebC/PmpR family DNA-binding transcriptional regulator [Candidatus Paceibacterota bacterium]
MVGLAGQDKICYLKTMSGHNKWSQIKNKKGVTDAKRSKLFSMLVRMITMEAKKAGGNKEAPSLKSAIVRAKEANMPLDNIERAIQKGFGGGAENFEEVTYEAYGPAGVALIITGVTDNKNRTTPEIKHILSNHGGSLGAQGSTMWAFAKNEEGDFVPQTPLPLSEEDQEKLNNLVEEIEGHEDIKNIYHNADIRN